MQKDFFLFPHRSRATFSTELEMRSHHRDLSWIPALFKKNIPFPLSFLFPFFLRSFHSRAYSNVLIHNCYIEYIFVFPGSFVFWRIDDFKVLFCTYIERGLIDPLPSIVDYTATWCQYGIINFEQHLLPRISIIIFFFVPFHFLFPAFFFSSIVEMT